MTTPFNKREIYESLLEEKIIELKRLCHMEKIPMFITVCLENNENGTTYEKEMVSAATCDFDLADDQIAKHVNVSLGFDTIQPSVEEDFDMEDVDLEYVEDKESNDDMEVDYDAE